MDEKIVKTYIKNGTNPYVEFSNCTTEFTDSVFQTICSFLNKEGGTLIVGVHDFGKIMGVADYYLDNMLARFANVLTREFTPSVSLTPEVVRVDGKKVLYISVPESTEVQRYRNKIYDRAGGEIIDVTYNYNLIENIYLRKKKESSENIVCPFLRMHELDDAAFKTMRKYIAGVNPGHRWLNMSNEEILHSAGFWRKDQISHKEGFVVAAVLLFGKEITIQNYAPVIYRTDAIYRNVRYDTFNSPLAHYSETKFDDRDIIFSNLIDSYTRLMSFAERNLPERIIRLDGKEVDIRKKLFGEVIANFLVHREYTNRFIGKLQIFSDRVMTENGAKPSQDTHISFAELEKNPKNPLIMRVFREMGLVGAQEPDQNRIVQYAPYYDKTYQIEIQNGETFVFSITYGNEGLDEPEAATPAAPVEEPFKPVNETNLADRFRKQQDPWPVYFSKVSEVCPELDVSYVDKAEIVLEFCVKPKPIQDMMRKARQSNRTRFRQNIIRPLIDEGLLAMRIPMKPSSPLQTYFTTEKGKTLLEL